MPKMNARTSLSDRPSAGLKRIRSGGARAKNTSNLGEPMTILGNLVLFGSNGSSGSQLNAFSPTMVALILVANQRRQAENLESLLLCSKLLAGTGVEKALISQG